MDLTRQMKIVSVELQAEKLVLLTNTPGILDHNGDTISTLTAAQINALIDDGTINEGMLPKVQCALDAVEGGVKSVQIVDGRVPHSLLLELFTAVGVGTQIFPGSDG